MVITIFQTRKLGPEVVGPASQAGRLAGDSTLCGFS